MELDAVANLPDRVGWFWLKARSPEALKIKTQELSIYQEGDLEKATLQIRSDPTIGKRFSRRNYEHLIAQRDERWNEETRGDLATGLTLAYRRARGEEA